MLDGQWCGRTVIADGLDGLQIRLEMRERQQVTVPVKIDEVSCRVYLDGREFEPIKTHTQRIVYRSQPKPDPITVSLLYECPEHLHEAVKRFLVDHEDWDSDRLLTESLQYFLSMQGYV